MNSRLLAFRLVEVDRLGDSGIELGRAAALSPVVIASASTIGRDVRELRCETIAEAA